MDGGGSDLGLWQEVLRTLKEELTIREGSWNGEVGPMSRQSHGKRKTGFGTVGGYDLKLPDLCFGSQALERKLKNCKQRTPSQGHERWNTLGQALSSLEEPCWPGRDRAHQRCRHRRRQGSLGFGPPAQTVVWKVSLGAKRAWVARHS